MSCLERIKGVIPASMLDWPGKVCAVLFLDGCNFRCPFCHNPDLVIPSGEDFLAWEEIEFLLQERALWIDGVSITGGEPTFHSDLPLLCDKLGRLSLPVKLDTNGSHPRILREILEGSGLEFIAMDLKTSLDRYPLVVRRPINPGIIEESIDLILASGVRHEFRCTVVPGLVGYLELRSLAARITGADRLVLQQFRPGETLDPDYADREGYPQDVLAEWAELLSSLVPTTVRGGSAGRSGSWTKLAEAK